MTRGGCIRADATAPLSHNPCVKDLVYLFFVILIVCNFDGLLSALKDSKL